MISWIKEHKTEAIVFLIALLVRTALFYMSLVFQQGDIAATVHGDDGYYELSNSLLAGQGLAFPFPPYAPNPLRTPLYPFFIAGILVLFKTYWAVAIIQMLIGSSIPVLGMRIVRRILPVPNIVLGVGLMLALEPFAALFSFIFYTETLFIFFFFLFLLYFFDYLERQTTPSIIIASLLLATAVLVKPTVQYIPPVLAGFMLWRFWNAANIRRVIWHIAVLFGIFLVLLAPWLYRNMKLFGVMGMTAQPAFTVYVYLVPSVLALHNGTDFQTELERLRKEDRFDENAITLATSRHFRTRAFGIVSQYPAELLKSAAITTITFFTHDGMLTVLQHAGFMRGHHLAMPALFFLLREPVRFFGVLKDFAVSPAFFILVGRIAWIVITLAAFIGAARFYKKREQRTPRNYLILFFVLYLLATTMIVGFGVNARYRMPVNVFLFMFALYAFSRLGAASNQKLSGSPDAQSANDRQKRFVPLLACPFCKEGLVAMVKPGATGERENSMHQGYTCSRHGIFPLHASGVPLLIARDTLSLNAQEHESGVNWLKSFLKRYPKLYYGIWHIFCPVLMAQNGPRKILPLLAGGVVLDVGSGPERLGKEFINVDVFPFSQVDIVADAAALPFRDDSVAGVVSESLLEHVANPQEVANEMVRVLKPGGLLYASAPFVHPYHASPDDFNRWTVSGLKSLFADLEIIETGVRSGPWSALLMFLAYWFGVVFSFGSKRAAPFLAHVCMLVLGPLKFLDIFFASIPGAEAVAAHLYVMGKKK
ncbi:MAG: methyltransferase domain-containing protein [Candidatus Sungbacteria bacterium]|nr:methyltransferase domain-containing protein [Candidatus Sungbacteria bacterium]